jgi:3-oxoacyl-[acyl-carrier-protein] synthase III
VAGDVAVPSNELCTVIRGAGSYLPRDVVASSTLEAAQGFDPGWCEERTGIQERRRAAPGELSYHLGARAARSALDGARISAEEIDLVLFSSTWSELLYPSPGVFLQRELGMSSGVPVIEVRAACAGFIAMLYMADPMLRCGAVRRVLCVAGERGHACEQNYRAAAPLFGDAGAAVVLAAEPYSRRSGVLYSRFYTSAEEAENCFRTSGVPAQGGALGALDSSDHRSSAADGNATRAHWDGASIFRNAVTCLGQSTDAALAALGLEHGEIDHYLYHQANRKILRSLCRQFKIPEARVAQNIESVGNTSSASVPLLLADALAAGRIRPGEKVLMGAFGAGYAYGVVVYEVPAGGGG